MSLYERVPEIDLSPEFNDGPLWAFVPRAYLRLLGDLFYFPQRVRDYVLVFARTQRGEGRPPASFSPLVWGDWLHANPLQGHFLLMVALLGVGSILLAVNGAGLLAALLAGGALSFGGMGLGMVVGIAALLILLVIGAAGDEAGALATFALPVGVGIGLLVLAFAAAPGYGLDGRSGALSLLCLLCGVGFGVGSAALFASASLGLNSQKTQALLAAIVGLAVGLAIGFAGWPAAPDRPATTEILLGDVLALALTTALGFLTGALRLDDYLLHWRAPGAAPRPADWLAVARVTPIPLPHLHDHVTAWLDFDWPRGLENAASLWWYTAQQETVRRALHDVLRVERSASGAQPVAAALSAATGALAARGDDKQADRLFEIVGRIADNPTRFPWDMVTYGNPSRAAMIWKQGTRESTPANASAYVQRRYKRQRLRRRALQRGAAAPLPMKSPEQAATAGFWYLERGYIADALDAFKKAPAAPLAREMVSILEALDTLSREENLLANPTLKLPERPKEPRRKATWDALDRVRQVWRFARLARHSTSAAKRESAAAEASRLLRALAQSERAPHAELAHLQRLAELWEAELTDWLVMRDAPQPLKPVENPFIFAEPLRRSAMFVGRERELAELKLAWSNDNLQPVILFGQPLIGKTSLLYAARSANPHVELAWFHLGHANRERAGIPQVLSAICAAVQQATVLDMVALDTRRPDPLPAIERAADPYAECERFIRHACTLLLPRNLILVMDDFDAVQGVIAGEAGAGASTLDQLLDFLEHLFQVVKNFNVVFVSRRVPLHFEKQQTSGFTGTARVQAVGPLEKRAVAKLLRPSSLPLHVTDEAVETVMKLSGGHPYLVQLLAHTAVERFNRQAAEQKGDPVQEPAEIEAAASDADLQQRAQALFRRLHQSAAELPQGETLLGILAQAVYGLERPPLAEALGIEQDALDALLVPLARAGLIEEDAQGRWRIRTELWRRWEAAPAAPA